MKRILLALLVLATGTALAGETPPDPGYGHDPVLPRPETSILPKVKIAKAVGWPKNRTPAPGAGFKVNEFASGLDHPRWLYVLPNGDVLVAETNGPERPQDKKGLKGWAQTKVMEAAGAGRPSANRITLLRDRDGDGIAEQKSTFLTNLYSPFGLSLIGNELYVANADAVLRFPYQQGDTEIKAPGAKVADLPGGPLNHHWTKGLIASRDGKLLYASVGSNSNIAENGMEAERDRAAILEIEPSTGKTRVFASGLRNPVGMAWEPKTGALWTVVNERDELGNNLVPDYMTSVKEGGFYGWPWSYFGQNVDERVKPQRPDLVAKAIVPDYALGSHTASLGLTFNEGKLFPERYHGGAFIGQHGSWNRSPLAGYKVIFVAFENGQPKGMPEDVLAGFVNPEGKAHGRPVGVVMDSRGALLVADDVGNAVWRVTPK